MMDLSQAQASLLIALHRLPSQRATVDDICARTQRRKTGFKKLEELGYVEITGEKPVYQGETDERVVTLTANGAEKAAELAKDEKEQPIAAAPARAPSLRDNASSTQAAAVSVEDSRPDAGTRAAQPGRVEADTQRVKVSSERKLAFLARMYLGEKVKIYADGISAVGVLTTVGEDFVHIVTNDGWDLVYDTDDIEVTAFNRSTRGCA